MARALYERQYMDLDDFEDFVLDKPEDQKWELINGHVVRSMVGARLQHHQIIQNVNFALRSHIRAKGLPCRTFTETFWLKRRFQKLAAFPDVMVRCGPIEPDAQSLDDPVILIEVVSPTSKNRDRGEKAAAYMRLASVKHVCFIDRDRILIEVFDRKEDAWRPRDPIDSPDAAFELTALAFSMPVAEVYRDVFPSPSP
jgi:Uma2 family endonuclease